jgi:hypothetical protein
LLDARVRVSLVGSYGDAVEPWGPAVRTLAGDQVGRMAGSVGPGANVAYTCSGTIASGAFVDLWVGVGMPASSHARDVWDLSVYLGNVVLLLIINTSATSARLVVGGAAAFPLPLWAAGNDKQMVEPKGLVALVNPTSGYAVGLGRYLRLAAPGGDVTYEMLIAGVDANPG